MKRDVRPEENALLNAIRAYKNAEENVRVAKMDFRQTVIELHEAFKECGMPIEKNTEHEVFKK